MSLIQRQTHVHFGDEAVAVNSHSGSGWLEVDISWPPHVERVTVYLTPDGMRKLARRLDVIADDMDAQPKPEVAPKLRVLTLETLA